MSFTLGENRANNASDLIVRLTLTIRLYSCPIFQTIRQANSQKVCCLNFNNLYSNLYSGCLNGSVLAIDLYQ